MRCGNVFGFKARTLFTQGSNLDVRTGGKAQGFESATNSPMPKSIIWLLCAAALRNYA